MSVETQKETLGFQTEVKQLLQLMNQELDVWVLPEQAQRLGSPLAIAEHVEGEAL